MFAVQSIRPPDRCGVKEKPGPGPPAGFTEATSNAGVGAFCCACNAPQISNHGMRKRIAGTGWLQPVVYTQISSPRSSAPRPRSPTRHISSKMQTKGIQFVRPCSEVQTLLISGPGVTKPDVIRR